MLHSGLCEGGGRRGENTHGFRFVISLQILSRGPYLPPGYRPEGIGCRYRPEGCVYGIVIRDSDDNVFL